MDLETLSQRHQLPLEPEHAARLLVRALRLVEAQQKARAQEQRRFVTAGLYIRDL
jgi:hypothetical protein